MVGSAGNAPVVTSDICFATPDLQSGSRITSQKLVAGVGVTPTEAELMRLASESHSPRSEMVESAGNAPASACLQGKCIACLPRPHENWQAALVLPQAS